MICIDGVYLTDGADPPVFRHVPSPGTAELQALVQCIAERIGRMLEKRGLIERDCENAWRSGDPEQAGSLDDLIGHSITYRITVGPRAGKKLFMLQAVPAYGEGEGRSGSSEYCASRSRPAPQSRQRQSGASEGTIRTRLTTRSVLEKFSAVQMIDVHIPTTDGRELVLTRYTQPEAEPTLQLERLKITLPPQPPPNITSAQAALATSV